MGHAHAGVKGRREAHLGIVTVLPGQFRGELVRDQLVVRGGAQAAADRAVDLDEVGEVAKSEPLVEPGKRVMGQGRAVLARQRERRRWVDGTLEMQVQLGLRGGTQVALDRHPVSATT
jgi:hypothetical protein